MTNLPFSRRWLRWPLWLRLSVPAGSTYLAPNLELPQGGLASLVAYCPKVLSLVGTYQVNSRMLVELPEQSPKAAAQVWKPFVARRCGCAVP